LLAHVKSLEEDLADIDQTMKKGTEAGTLSGDGLIKQTDAGKRLLKQLQAIKNASASSTEATAGDPPAPKPTTAVDGDGKVRRARTWCLDSHDPRLEDSS
jgi:hypothetical protein